MQNLVRVYVSGHGPNGHPIINGQRGSLQVGYGDNFPSMPHHAAASCPETGTCDWDDFNSPEGTNENSLSVKP